MSEVSKTNELIAEARHEESIQDKLGDGFSEGSEDRAFYYQHRDRYRRLANALEAANRERDAALSTIANPMKQNITDELQKIIETARESGQLSTIQSLLQIAKRYNKDGWIIQAKTLHEVANEIIQKHQIKTKE